MDLSGIKELGAVIAALITGVGGALATVKRQMEVEKKKWRAEIEEEVKKNKEALDGKQNKSTCKVMVDGMKSSMHDGFKENNEQHGVIMTKIDMNHRETMKMFMDFTKTILNIYRGDK